MSLKTGSTPEGQILDHIEGDYERVRGGGNKPGHHIYRSVATGEQVEVVVSDKDQAVLVQFLHNLGRGAKHLVLRITQGGKGPMVLEGISSPTLDTVLKSNDRDRKYLE